MIPKSVQRFSEKIVPRQQDPERSIMRANGLLVRASVVAVLVAALSGLTPTRSAAEKADVPDLPAFARRGLPGPGHAALAPLVGIWRVENSIYIAIGTPGQPVVSDQIICRREWVAGGRFLRDVTEGTIGGGPYWREGLLGYSNMDQRYEWVTADGFNANMMIYLGDKGSGARQPIVMSGVFTDQGVVGEQAAGKEVGMRTVISIESRDRHVFELYVTPPGAREFLADRKVYTRIAN
jgi:Protein of unknown function (DUF1579)